MSLGLDDGVDILRVDHAQHAVTEHTRACELLHDEDLQATRKAGSETITQRWRLISLAILKRVIKGVV